MPAFVGAIGAAGLVASAGAAEPKPKAERGERTIGMKFFGEGGAARPPKPVPTSPEIGEFQEEYARQVGEAQRPKAPASDRGEPEPEEAVEADAPEPAPAAEPLAPASAGKTAMAAPRRGAADSSARARGVASARARSEGEPKDSGPAALFGPGERPRDSVRSPMPLERVAAHASAALAGRSPAGPALAGAIGAAGLRPLSRPSARPLSAAGLAGVFDAAPKRPALQEPPQRPQAPLQSPAVDSPRSGPELAQEPAGPEPRAPAAPGGPGLVRPATPIAPLSAGTVFVSMDLDLSRTPGEYRDAVAGLERTARFSLDSRFAPVYRDSRRDRVSVWGRLPADQVRQVLAMPGVERLEAVPQAPPAAPPAGAREAEGDWRLVLRLPPESPGTPESASFATALLRLSEAGFVWKRSEPRDASGLVAVIGAMPGRSLERVLADPSVVRVTPNWPEPKKPASRAPLQASAGPAALLGRYLQSHPLWLLLAALLPMVARAMRQAGVPDSPGARRHGWAPPRQAGVPDSPSERRQLEARAPPR